MKVEIYSDVACPWCYVGKRRFERALTAFGREADVVYRPFQLDPAAPLTPRPLSEYLQGKFGGQVDQIHARLKEVGREEGIDFRLEQAQAVNTLAAHRLLHLARTEHGAEVQARLKAALLDAYFTGGADVGATETLAGIAEQVGISRERAVAYLVGGEGTAEVRAEIDQARGIGVQAVPTFVFNGRYAVQGAQPVSTFLQVLEQAAAAEEPAAAEEDPSCADGACAIPEHG
ncbi:MAG: DsbA family oxidoreductase [Nocardiopsaceae bacterium]|nr:DsbA family oxidoreductase [Nocardiopsaceae bacterium]